MKSQTTPTPWHDEETGIGAIQIIGDDNQLVALVYGETPAIQKANARLIAKSYDLLKTAEDLVRICRMYAENNVAIQYIIKQGEATIKKAQP